MANRFFQPGVQRSAKVDDLFARIASRYDLINDLQSLGLHRHWKRLVVNLVQPHSNSLALDLCCGTGDIAWSLAKRGATVMALDFSDRMLQVARQRSAGMLGRNIEGSALGQVGSVDFVRGDALKLPFSDNTFECVTMGYGLRNLASWESGLCEMMRVTKPGGRLAILEFGKPESRLWRGFYLAYLQVFVPLLGLAFCGNATAYGYILESLRHYPAQQIVASKMSELGLAEVRVINLMGGAMSINFGSKAMSH